MINIHFQDWGEKRPKKHYNRIHEMRIFELIFSNKLSELGMKLGKFENIIVYCLADPNKRTSYEENHALQSISVSIPDDFMDFLNLDSANAKFQAFSYLVHTYIKPILERYSTLPQLTVSECVKKALEQIIKQNYEVVFLVGKTPKKSPDRKKLAILKGIHRLEGFQLRCEVYNEKGLKIMDQILVRDVGNEIVYSRYLGALKWENDHHIVVKSSSSNWMAEIHVED